MLELMELNLSFMLLIVRTSTSTERDQLRAKATTGGLENSKLRTKTQDQIFFYMKECRLLRYLELPGETVQRFHLHLYDIDSVYVHDMVIEVDILKQQEIRTAH